MFAENRPGPAPPDPAHFLELNFTARPVQTSARHIPGLLISLSNPREWMSLPLGTLNCSNEDEYYSITCQCMQGTDQ